MDKGQKNQKNASLESHLWEEVSDEAAAACVGGSNGELKSIVQGILHHLVQIIAWGGLT